jgi:putative ABC transport system ATP-binding protein
MSGGQAQRAAAARAMVTEPAVLFADEPTGALDALAGEQVMSQIVRVAREAGTSVVIITHDAKIAAYGDREIVVRDGMLELDQR